MKKDLKDIKEKVMNWSGFELEGETKQEMFDSLKSIQYKLECEISDYSRGLRKMIDKLDIEEGC